MSRFARRTPQVPARRLLVTGAGQGARRINQTVWGALDGLDATARIVRVLDEVAGRT